VTSAGAPLALALLLTACGGGGSTDKTEAPPTPASSSASATPEQAQKQAVVKAFTAMWTERTKAYARASLKGTKLTRYATLDALGQIRNDVARMKAAGTVVRSGARQTDPKVTALDTSKSTPKATLTTCVDLSHYQAYDTKAEKPLPLPSAQPRRYTATASMERWPNGWMVTAYEPHGDRSC
jgi:hypothetical protein